MPEPRLKVEAVSLKRLTPDPENARIHSERNIEAIARSLDRFGQRKPLVIQQKGRSLIIRAGNGTYEAAKRLGWETLERSAQRPSTAQSSRDWTSA